LGRVKRAFTADVAFGGGTSHGRCRWALKVKEEKKRERIIVHS